MGLIELKNIYKEYTTDQIITPALTDIHLVIEKGDFVSIIGASGSGKTTLLNIIGCMDLPTKGEYCFAGKNISSMTEHDLAKIRGKQISFIFQNFALIENMTVYENVEIPLLKQGLKKAERDQKISSALKAVGIDSLSKKRPAHISGGQKQRVAIARAIACGADVILADEPTGALDSKTAKEIMQLLTKLNETGTTVIVITHDMNVAAYAHRILESKDGRIEHDMKLHP